MKFLEPFLEKPVLIVDDSDVDRTDLRRYFRGTNVRVEESESCEDALSLILAPNTNYGCILLDYRLPDGDGLTLLKKIREVSSRVYPVVLLTGMEDENLAVECLKQGAQDYLIKSNLNKDQVFRAIRFANERVTLELELFNEKIKAEQANDSKTKFLSMVSHELRTPLNSLIVLSQSLLKNIENNLSARQLEQVSVIEGSSAQLLHMVNDLLDVSRIEANNVSFLVDIIDFPTLLEGLQRSYEGRGGEKEINIEFHNIAEDLYLETDYQRLEQILRNFLDNAFKFTFDGKVTVSIEEGLNCLKNKLLKTVDFIVEDTGIGIHKDKQKFIFDIFEQVSSGRAREYGGVGLGLSISRSFAQLMGGEVLVNSTFGEGARFILRLPASWDLDGVTESVSGDIHYSEKYCQSQISKEFRPERVVVIFGDCSRQLYEASKVMKRHGYRVFLSSVKEMEGIALEGVSIEMIVVLVGLDEKGKILPRLKDLVVPCAEDVRLVLSTDWKSEVISSYALSTKGVIYLDKKAFHTGLESYLISLQ